ncbi:sulfatase-like hydrolase/transferase [Roseimaritima ulvae]|uniref:Sulfatase n=1 Tax=Roseimaritima ulvae TaxID=980254 RepID=A0A5B9QYX9_9BACT|nr:sulfatase-like hydrolase/transferase [Roseimaritima ulvae]QEG43060.1 Sulfatase [Roseimaritima ulvae]
MRPLPSPALLVLLVLLAISARLQAQVSAADRPNIVWIMSEDNSKHYLRLFDPAGAATPQIEKLAQSGVVFDRAFSNAPVCSVARTTLITSCYGPRIGTQFHRRSKLAAMPEGLQMFPAYLRAAGYYTTNNSKKDYNAIEGAEVWDASSGKASWRNRPSDETPFFHVQTFGMSHESSLHFGAAKMQSEATQHDPDAVQLAPYFPDTPTFRYTHARYLDRMQTIDTSVGQLIAKLEADGVLEDTFVFYFGDHGGVLPRSKGYVYESGLHVPLVVRIPKNFKSLSAFAAGSRTAGFVEFVDFGPTVLSLAGVEVPEGVDGKPFLGKSITAAEVNARDETLGYADRFDEKYDFVRSLRVGPFKYIRNYEAFQPDGLQNNYRYRMLAYQDWRTRYHAGELNDMQSQFFRSKPVEALYDIENDPHETRNLAADPQHRETLLRLRGRLQQRMKAMPDLSLFPESELVQQAMDNPVAFGQQQQPRISRLLDTVDACLLPAPQAVDTLRTALDSTDPLQRMWALVACSSMGTDAAALAEIAKRLHTDDPHRLTRVRAAQFLAILGRLDPAPTIYRELASTNSEVEALEILNVAVFCRDALPSPQTIDADRLRFSFKVSPKSEVQRRVEYLQR